MTEPKHAWFQWHLLTCIIIVVVAGGVLLGLNMFGMGYHPGYKSGRADLEGRVLQEHEKFGWPILLSYRMISPPYERVRFLRLGDSDTFVNLFVCAGILVGVAAASEWILRRFGNATAGRLSRLG